MARSLAQTKHLDTTDCLPWRLCLGNLQPKTQANHGWDGSEGVACPYDAMDQQGTNSALGLRQTGRARKEPMLPQTIPCTTYVTPSALPGSAACRRWPFLQATRDDTKHKAQDVRALGVTRSFVVPL